MPPPAIQVGDIVNVTLAGTRPSVLAKHEVVNIPSVGSDYWEFEAPNGVIIAATGPVSVVKAAP